MAKETKENTMGEKLFPKFGEFDSAEEINRAAEAQKKEGDLEALKELAKENGIDEMDAEDYMDDINVELCTHFSAAMGKIQREVEYLKPTMTLEAWNTFLYEMMMGEMTPVKAEPGTETTLTVDETGENITLCKAIRSKGKYLCGLYAKVIIECFRTRAELAKEIKDECRKLDSGIPNNFSMGDISRTRLKEIIREYYLGN